MALDKVTVGVLADNAVTTSKIAAGTVVAADNGDATVTIPKIKEENITKSAIKRSFHKSWILGS